jgi:starch-binding outer membrane protein, SusD/RagB family
MKIYKTAFLLLLIAFVAGCSKNEVVDLQPIDLIPSDRAISDMNSVTQALQGVYGTWQARRSVYISSLISDEVRLGTGTEYRNVGNILFNWQHVSDSQDWRDAETGGVWTNMYAVIDRANRLLELMEPVPTANATEASLKTQYRGELLALRAMAHLELLRHFSETPDYQPEKLGVVIMTEYAKGPGTHRPTRNTQAQVVTQINTDLTEARALIPASFTNSSRITRNAVIASQARVALYTKNWQEVVDRTSEVIPLQPLTPLSEYAALWTTRNLPDNQSTEVIWQYNITLGNLGFALGSLYQDLNAAVQASPSEKLLNSYDKINDIRFATFFRTSPRNLIAKHGVVIGSNSENFLYDIKMIRTSEMVLARAEAYAELNQLGLANADLRMLRAARITGYTHVDINDRAALIAAILQERYKELAYEGQRYLDLRRRLLPIQRDLSDVAGNTAIQVLQPTESKYLLPIPQQELLANPNIGQNPGF